MKKIFLLIIFTIFVTGLIISCKKKEMKVTVISIILKPYDIMSKEEKEISDFMLPEEALIKVVKSKKGDTALVTGTKKFLKNKKLPFEGRITKERQNFFYSLIEE